MTSDQERSIAAIAEMSAEDRVKVERSDREDVWPERMRPVYRVIEREHMIWLVFPDGSAAVDPYVERPLHFSAVELQSLAYGQDVS